VCDGPLSADNASMHACNGSVHAFTASLHALSEAPYAFNNSADACNATRDAFNGTLNACNAVRGGSGVVAEASGIAPIAYDDIRLADSTSLIQSSQPRMKIPFPRGASSLRPARSTTSRCACGSGRIWKLGPRRYSRS
jgi:hypothetical protein